ncbi:TPA: phage antirepressor KilAC domain-containing protein [Burkholderia cenocepacia]
MNNGLMNFDPAQPVTMSSRDIAELVEVRHPDVIRSIERLMQKGAIGEYTPTAYTHPQNRQTYDEYHIGKRDSYVIVAQLSPEFTARLVDRWQELETGAAKSAFAIPKTLGAALRLAADLEEKRAALEVENKQQAQLIEYHRPDVQFAEAMRASDDLADIPTVAKTLSKIKPIGPIQLGRALRECGIFRKDHKENLPMQKFVNAGFFTVIPSTWTAPDGAVKTHYKVMVTGAGLQPLTDWYVKYIETLPPTLSKKRK